MLHRTWIHSQEEDRDMARLLSKRERFLSGWRYERSEGYSLWTALRYGCRLAMLRGRL